MSALGGLASAVAEDTATVAPVGRPAATSSSNGTDPHPAEHRGRADFVRRARLSRLQIHLVLLLLAAFVPTAGLLLLATLEQNQHAGVAARQDALRWARVIAGEHERTIESARQLLTMLAQLPDIRQQRPDRCNALVTDLQRRYSRYTNLGAVTLNGSVFCSAAPPGEPMDLGGGAHFWRAVENGGFEVGEYRIDRATGRPTVNLSYPLIDDTGAVQGAVFAAVDLTWLTQLPALAQLPEGSGLTISDRQGRARFRFPDPARWAGQVVWDAAVLGPMAAMGEGAVEARSTDGATRAVGFAVLPGGDGGARAYLAVDIPHGLWLAGPVRGLTRSLIVLGLIATLVLVAARLIGNQAIPPRTEAAPARALTRAVEEQGPSGGEPVS
jgi:cache domain-containing protein